MKADAVPNGRKLKRSNSISDRLGQRRPLKRSISKQRLNGAGAVAGVAANGVPANRRRANSRANSRVIPRANSRVNTRAN